MYALLNAIDFLFLRTVLSPLPPADDVPRPVGFPGMVRCISLQTGLRISDPGDGLRHTRDRRGGVCRRHALL